MVRLTGANLVAGEERAAGPATVTGRDPRTGKRHDPHAHEATRDEVSDAVEAAARAASDLASTSPTERARLLGLVADALDEAGPELVAHADAETALGQQPRLEGELNRTTAQLRFLADVIDDGAYLEATIDHLAHGPTVRRVLVPLGPVVVFAASNFPLAFSVAGGDTASALAAGCPVVVKAHPSHPLTSELTARIISDALATASAPSGTFSLVHGFEAGRQLVRDERVEAVAFTGSFQGGMALVQLARERMRPIPVYAEMGSLNPVVITPGAASRRGDAIAQGFVDSFTLGTGQFCTKPGLLFAPSGSAGEALADAIVKRVDVTAAGPMLNSRIHENWRETVDRWKQLDAVQVLSAGSPPEGSAGSWASPIVIETDAATFDRTGDLRTECFGPTSVLVRYRDVDELARSLTQVSGNLAAAIHATDGEDDFVRRIAALLTARVGRLIWNGWPTGVAVTWAMHHGGPFPATSDPLFTSVGAASLRRFLRPLAFQDAPDDILPASLQDANPLAIPRRVDGRLQPIDL